MPANPKEEEIFSDEYTKGDELITNSVKEEPSKEIEEDFSSYTLNKPTRITIRASVINDKD